MLSSAISPEPELWNLVLQLEWLPWLLLYGGCIQHIHFEGVLSTPEPIVWLQSSPLLPAPQLAAWHPSTPSRVLVCGCPHLLQGPFLTRAIFHQPTKHTSLKGVDGSADPIHPDCDQVGH